MTTLIELFANENGTTTEIEMRKIVEMLDKQGITGEKREDMISFFTGPCEAN